MIGQTVGDYRITDKLGEGGFGVVYKAVELSLDRVVALKTMDALLTRDVKFRERFFKEAKTQAGLNHPNIVTIHRFFEHDGRYFIVMEQMDGVVLPGGQRARNIGDLVKLGPVPEGRVRDVFRQVLAGVAFAHSRGVLHRDIKPLNILFGEAGIAKVADFGIAKIVGGDTNVSVSGTRVGTPAYMSPEQVLNRPLDRRTDIYSLGCMLYEMAAGAMPFQATSTTSMEEQHLAVPPPPPRSRNPWLSEDMERVILKAMAKKPDERHQDCGEFLAALEGGVRSEERGAKREDIDRTVPEGRVKSEERGAKREERRVKSEERRHAERALESSPAHHPLERSAAGGRRKGFLVFLVLAAVAAVAVVGFLLLRGPAGPREFELPELKGLNLAAARDFASGKGLVPVAAESTLTDDVDKGAVLSVVPAGGSTAKAGDTVRLTWSWGRKTCPECGTARKGEGKFCTRCGYSF